MRLFRVLLLTLSVGVAQARGPKAEQPAESPMSSEDRLLAGALTLGLGACVGVAGALLPGAALLMGAALSDRTGLRVGGVEVGANRRDGSGGGPVLEGPGVRVEGGLVPALLSAAPSLVLLGTGLALTVAGVGMLGGGVAHLVGSALEMGESTSPVRSETRLVTAFERLEISGAYDVEVTQGPATEVRLTGPGDLVESTETRVKGNTLHVEQRHGVMHWGHSAVKLHVTTPNLSDVELEGAGSVVIHDFTGPVLHAELSGAGSLDVTAHVDRLSVELSGAGSATFREARELTAEVTGTGSLDAEALVVHVAKVSLAGAGSAVVAVDEVLDVTISGVGSVTYKGNPKQLHQDVSGLGSLRQR